MILLKHIAVRSVVCNLADHGAEVIKIEPPNGDQTRNWGPLVNDYSGYYAYLNRNKRGLAIDLKTEAGKEVLTKLIKEADVIIENFKAGTFAKLGFTYKNMKEINPKIIYGQLTGFGLDGPMSSRAAYDIVAQAEGGYMSVNGFADKEPVKVGPCVADSFTGTFLSLAVMMALFNRERTGEGSHVNVSMLDTMFSTLEGYVVEYTLTGRVPGRNGNRGTSMAPWDLFTAKDGYFVAGCGTDKHWKLLCDVLGMDTLRDDPQYSTASLRVKAASYLKKCIEEKTALLTVAEIEEKLTTSGIPFGKVNDVSQVTNMEQIKHRNMLWEVFDPGFNQKFVMPGTPMKFNNSDDSVTCAAPTLGQHNSDILREIGYSEEEITVLIESGILAQMSE